jgi:hypothetical protein
MSQSLPNFAARREEYVLHNAGPERVEGSWGGRSFTIPACDDVHPHSPAYYADGSPIPGTIVLHDGYTHDREGKFPKQGDPFNWRAAVAIKNVLGIDPKSNEAVGKYAQKGISFVAMPATPEHVAEIMAEGKKRYHQFMLKWADQKVRDYATAQEVARKHGSHAPPPDSDYPKAVAILRANETELEKRYGPQSSPIDDLPDDEDLEFMAFAKAKLEALAKQAAEAHKVDERKLVESYLEDPDMLRVLRKKYRIRKVGFAEGVEPAKVTIPERVQTE